MTNLFGRVEWPSDVIYNVQGNIGGCCKGSADVTLDIPVLTLTSDDYSESNQQLPQEDHLNIMEVHGSITIETNSEDFLKRNPPVHNSITLTSADYSGSN